MKSEEKKELKELYSKLLENYNATDTCVFSVQWGENFSFNETGGILFVGKAVNGWITRETNVEKLFSEDNPDRIFNRSDQMKWVSQLDGNTNGYNTRKSAFWRLIRKVTETHYPEQWYANIAWTNLYKIAPWNGGNPGAKLQKKQRALCTEILQKEIEILKPKYVVFLTSGWENEVVDLSGQAEITVNWDKYSTTLIEKNGVKFIKSVHPQGKNETNHKNAILELFNS